MSEGNTREISVSELRVHLTSFAQYIRRKYRLLTLCTLIGALLGLGSAFLLKPKYTAVCTFVLEDNDHDGMLAQYAGLASLAGVDIGGGSSGIFKGNNILELYKSRTMLQKTLLSETMINGKKQLLIDRYIQYNRLREKWDKDDEIKQINFSGNPLKFGRKQDSIITDLADIINEKYLDVSKPDKKLSIIRVAFTSKDELFAKVFTDLLVANVNEFYVSTKTKKSTKNVQILQFQADSLRRILNTSLYGVASAIDADPNANPALLSLRVPSQKKQIDVQTNSAIYSEVVKNLELSKMSLRQQTPLIQFIDQPVFPLIPTKIGKLKGLIIGSLLGLVICIVTLAGKRLLSI